MQFSIVSKAYAAFGECTPGSGINLSDCLLLNDGTPVSERTVYTQVAPFATFVVRNLFVFAGIILFFLILLAGFKLITGGKKGVEEARTIISAAITGFLIMFSAYWIVQIVKLITGADIPI